jgi:hypothetical protein
VSRVGNYIADRQQLSDMVEEHQRVIKAWDEHVEALNQVQGDANKYVEMKKIDNEQEKEREEKKKVLEFWNGMAQADYDAKRNFQTASEGFVTIFSKLDTLAREIRKTNGNLEKLNVNGMQEIFFKDEDLLTVLLYKFGNGMLMSEGEREILHGYIQKEILTDENLKDIDTLLKMFEAGDYNGIQDYLNTKVLASPESLELEMALIQAYLFTGNMHMDDFSVNGLNEEELQVLVVYLGVLENYNIYLNEMKRVTAPDSEFHMRVVKFEDEPIEVEDDGEVEELPGYRIRTSIIIGLENSAGFADNSVVSYYINFDGIESMEKDKRGDFKKAQGEFQYNLGVAELKNTLIGTLAAIPSWYTKLAAAGIATVDKVFSVNKELNDLEEEWTMEQQKDVAKTLGMEVLLSEQENLMGDKVLYVQVFPTRVTFDIIDRWEEVHRLNNNIPYPEEAVQQNDWKAISEFYFKNKNNIHEINSGLINYIGAGSKNTNISMEELSGLE